MDINTLHNLQLILPHACCIFTGSYVYYIFTSTLLVKCISISAPCLWVLREIEDESTRCVVAGIGGPGWRANDPGLAEEEDGRY